MKLIIICVLHILYLIQLINCKEYRPITKDELLNYDLDESISSFSNWFSVENLKFEQIDDDNVEIGGYVECIQSLDRAVPLQAAISTQAQEKGSWKNQAVKLFLANGCNEAVNPDRFWYNISKLWTADVCPPLKGYKLKVETQRIKPLINLPESMSTMPWRAYVLVSQTNLMGKKVEFGFGVEAEFVPA